MMVSAACHYPPPRWRQGHLQFTVNNLKRCPRFEQIFSISAWFRPVEFNSGGIGSAVERHKYQFLVCLALKTQLLVIDMQQRKVPVTQGRRLLADFPQLAEKWSQIWMGDLVL